MTAIDVPYTPFIPPYPPRWPKPPSSWKRLLLGQKNLLGMWEDESFDLEFSEGRVLARMVYVCNSPNAVQFALTQRNASFERKSAHMRHALTPLLGDGLFISDGDTWRQRRAIVQPIVHIARLTHFAPVMVETALEMHDRWRAAGPKEMDLLAESAHLTAEIICRTIFGRELGRQHSAEVVGGFTEYQEAVAQIDVMYQIGLPDWVPRLHSRRTRRAKARIQRVLDNILQSFEERRAAGETSLVSLLLDARDESGAPLSKEAIRNEVAVLFMAGHETTANALAWTWYLLSQASSVEQKLHAELESVLKGRAPELNDVPNLVYTRAIIDEAMRLYPPVAVLARECLVDEHYNGYRIPKGSLVMVVPWLLHRHRKLWSNPDAFIPERFLPGSGEPVSKYAYVPFSSGPRICPGMAFGITEAVLCLATLAQTFRLELRRGYKVNPVCRLTLRPEHGLPMTAHPRMRADASATPRHAG